MRIAFWTPLKSPAHRVPSGDRTVARNLRDLLKRAGHDVIVLNRRRTGSGLVPPEGLEAQRRRDEALLARALAAQAAPPDLFLTYHVYYKRPDWIGPAAARRLGIPYVVAEASYAPKRAGGPWDAGHRQVAACIGAADLVLSLNPNDTACVRPLMKPDARLIEVPPFIATHAFRRAMRHAEACRAALRARIGLPAGMPLLLTVAMMRPGDKLASYRLLAEALMRIDGRPWHLVVVGDGEARAAVAESFDPLAGRVTFLGACPPEELPALYAGADLYAWPAVNEAWGMTLLEAQAAGLPVVAGRTGGVPNVVRAGETGLLPPVGDALAFAAALAALLDDPAARSAMAAAAPAYVARRHARPVAQSLVDGALRALLEKEA